MTTNQIEATHVLLWSCSQCALHIEPVAQMLKANRRAYASNYGSDYLPIHMGSDEECRKAAELARETMSDRQHGRELFRAPDFI
ncbi:hypothetical protein HNP33_002056 [Comamonas odontotermitis]|uniref:Uncharacterized protein n=1 Tax=Comamonas odontotermitis TaxID=379895 RepID=A0ABR6RFR1_9BURK|nr:hypothetical protein [Comamonas odontotermitis]MBB6577988.1 hypothetical protein [Comamonas odontotermitis]